MNCDNTALVIRLLFFFFERMGTSQPFEFLLICFTFTVIISNNIFSTIAITYEMNQS